MRGFILSVVRPAVGEAKFGKATVSGPFPRRADLRNFAFDVLREYEQGSPAMPESQAWRYAEQISEKPLGVESVELRLGLHFRIDKAEDAPHPCPCCGRLVLPTDHAYAHDKNAYCLGCFTWNRSTPAGLPENTAHATREESCG